MKQPNIILLKVYILELSGKMCFDQFKLSLEHVPHFLATVWGDYALSIFGSTNKK